MVKLETNRIALTAEDAAEIMRISPYTVKKYIRDGRLKAQLISGKYYTTEEEIHKCQVIRGLA